MCNFSIVEDNQISLCNLHVNEVTIVDRNTDYDNV